MKSIKALILAIILYNLPPNAAAQATDPAPQSQRAKASLDLLVSRVDAYWKFLLEDQRSPAAEYVFPPDRERFLKTPIARFSSPTLKSLELSADRMEARVGVSVKRALPVGLVDWLQRDKWLFADGNWYLDFDFESKPLPGSERKAQKTGGEEKGEAAEKELRDRIHFERTVLNFGTVRQGAPVVLSLRYSLDGKEAVEMAIRKSSPAIQIQGLTNRRLPPGQGRELTVRVNSAAFDGAVDENFILVARAHEIEAPFEFKLQGFVYTPVSIFPKLVELDSAGKEREKEIRVRNNSRETLELKSLQSNAGNIAIEPLPATIAPGQELKMKVRQIRDVAEPDTAEFICIDFARPVEDMAYVGVNVVINPSPKKKRQIADPALSREIQEIIQKQKVNLPPR
jgi:hypothetical protein